MSRPSEKPKTVLEEIADNVAALTKPTTTNTSVQRHPGRGENGDHGRNPKPENYRAEHPSLLRQLVRALQPATVPAGEGGGSSKPSSRPPSAAQASAALQRIAEEARWLHRDLSHQAGRTVGPMRSLSELIESARGLAFDVDESWRQRFLVATDTWIAVAQETLGLVAPIVTLLDVRCLGCWAPVQIRADVSSDAWCSDVSCRDGEGRRYRWTRGEWGLLLEGNARYAAAKAEQEAAERVAAQASVGAA